MSRAVAAAILHAALLLVTTAVAVELALLGWPVVGGYLLGLAFGVKVGRAWP